MDVVQQVRDAARVILVIVGDGEHIEHAYLPEQARPWPPAGGAVVAAINHQSRVVVCRQQRTCAVLNIEDLEPHSLKPITFSPELGIELLHHVPVKFVPGRCVPRNSLLSAIVQNTSLILSPQPTNIPFHLCRR